MPDFGSDQPASPRSAIRRPHSSSDVRMPLALPLCFPCPHTLLSDHVRLTLGRSRPTPARTAQRNGMATRRTRQTAEEPTGFGRTAEPAHTRNDCARPKCRSSGTAVRRDPMSGRARTHPRHPTQRRRNRRVHLAPAGHRTVGLGRSRRRGQRRCFGAPSRPVPPAADSPRLTAALFGVTAGRSPLHCR